MNHSHSEWGLNVVVEVISTHRLQIPREGNVGQVQLPEEQVGCTENPLVQSLSRVLPASPVSFVFMLILYACDVFAIPSALHLLDFCVCLAPEASMPRLIRRTDQIYLTARSGSRVRFLAVGGIADSTYQMIQLDRGHHGQSRCWEMPSLSDHRERNISLTASPWTPPEEKIRES